MPDDERKETKKSLYYKAAVSLVHAIITIVISWYATYDVPEDSSSLVIPIYVIAGFVVFFEISTAGLLAVGALKENEKLVGFGLGAFVAGEVFFIALVATVAALFIEQGYWSTTICIVVTVIIVVLVLVGIWMYWKSINSARAVFRGQ